MLSGYVEGGWRVMWISRQRQKNPPPSRPAGVNGRSRGLIGLLSAYYSSHARTTAGSRIRMITSVPGEPESDRPRAAPKRAYVRESIMALIADHVGGEALPSEYALCKQLAVSRPTLRA